MKTCPACGREFARQRTDPMDCPFCGYNTAPKGGPRTEASLKRMQAETDDGEADPE